MAGAFLWHTTKYDDRSIRGASTLPVMTSVFPGGVCRKKKTATSLYPVPSLLCYDARVGEDNRMYSYRSQSVALTNFKLQGAHFVYHVS